MPESALSVGVSDRQGVGRALRSVRFWVAVKCLAVCAAIGIVAGCKASAGGKINSSGDADGQASFEGEPDVEPEPAVQSSAALADAEQGRGGVALLGARHDLFLRAGAPAKSCNCLRISAGQPRDQAFEWESVIPTIDSRSQVVVAFSSRGEVCEGEPEGSQGASYHGYEQRGPDVFVMIEASRPGRPLVGGAILPRPDAGGRILVQPVPADVPYGKAGDRAACEVVAEPGATSAPLAEGVELPEPEPDASTAFAEDESLDGDPNRPVDETEELERRRTGLYLGTQLGAAYMRVSPSDEDDFPTFSGFGFNFDLLIGGSPARDLAIGGLIGGAAAPRPRSEDPDAPVGDDVSMNAFRLGAFADYYFSADGNLHGMAVLGYEGLAFSRDEQAVGGSGDGLLMALGLGYDFWFAQRWSAGFLLRGGYTVLSFPAGRAGLLTPLLAGTLTYH